MAYIFLDKRKKPHLWRFQYTDHTGRRRTGTGTSSRRYTQGLAEIAEAQARAIRRNWAQAPRSSDTFRAFGDVVAEYLAWGRAQGGIGGRPWSKHHSDLRERFLKFWGERLGFQTLRDLEGVLPRVEEALRKMKKPPRKPDPEGAESKKPEIPSSHALPTYAGKTLQNRAEALAAFCRWCVKRGYLADDPLKGLAPFDTTPRTCRRALTQEEIQRFLAATETSYYGIRRRLGYEVALASGLRRNELRSLRVRHLDAEGCGLRLKAAWTKNRKDGFQPLSRALVDKLVATAAGKGPEEPLVFVARNSAKSLYRDLARAGIPVWTPAGRVDFHALRVAYTTFVGEVSMDPQTLRTLARHSDLRLTLKLYAKAREDRLASVAEAVGAAVLGPKTPLESTPFAHRKAVGAEHLDATLEEIAACAKKHGGSVWESNPPIPLSGTHRV